jgi:hypothetical protein
MQSYDFFLKAVSIAHGKYANKPRTEISTNQQVAKQRI